MSSMYVKLRVCSPSPQISIAPVPSSCASITLRQTAAGAFSRPPAYVPYGPVHVVEARHAHRDAVVLHEVAAHALAEELLPAVAVLRHRRVRVLLLQRRHVRVGLLARGVHARGRAEHEVLDAVIARGEQQVRVDQHRDHAVGLVRLDEAHAAHVGGEIEDVRRAVGRRVARLLLAQVGGDVVDAVVLLIPAAERLQVDGANVLEAAALQLGDEMSADEAAAPVTRTRLLRSISTTRLILGSATRKPMDPGSSSSVSSCRRRRSETRSPNRSDTNASSTVSSPPPSSSTSTSGRSRRPHEPRLDAMAPLALELVVDPHLVARPLDAPHVPDAARQHDARLDRLLARVAQGSPSAAGRCGTHPTGGTGRGRRRTPSSARASSGTSRGRRRART